MKRTQICVDEAVAIEHQDRIGRQPPARKAHGPGGAERSWLDHSFNRQRIFRAPVEMIEDRLRPMTQREDDPARAEALQPLQQEIEIGSIADGRQELRHVPEHRPYPRSEAARQHETVAAFKAPAARHSPCSDPFNAANISHPIHQTTALSNTLSTVIGVTRVDQTAPTCFKLDTRELRCRWRDHAAPRGAGSRVEGTMRCRQQPNHAKTASRSIFAARVKHSSAPPPTARCCKP